jgi:hypothetical protein
MAPSSRSAMGILCGATLAAAALARNLIASAPTSSPPLSTLTSVRGVNYVPSYSQHPLQTLLNHDSFIVHQELTWLGSLGFNAARIFLHSLPWQLDDAAFWAVTDDLVAACAENGMRVLFVVFDSTCGNGGTCDPTLAWLTSGYYNDVSTWVPNPGPAAIANLTLRPTLDAYVAALVGRYANDSRLLGWDMHNEPDFGDPNMLAFVTHYFALIQATDPSPAHVATTGLISADEQHIVQGLVRTLSFHDYDGGGRVPGANLAATVAAQQQLAAGLGKEVLLTESMGRPKDPLSAVLLAVSGCVVPTPAGDGGGSEGAASSAPSAPAPIGFFVWEGMNGRDEWSQNLYQGLLYPASEGPAFSGAWVVPDEKLWWQGFAGVTGDGATGCPVPPASTLALVADTDPRVAYAPPGAWTAWSGSGPRAGTLHYANASGATATFVVPAAGGGGGGGPVATSASIVHKAGPDCGIFRVLVDGAVVATIDAFAADVAWGVEAPAFLLAPVGQGASARTIEVVGTGTANPLSTNTYTQVVGFNVYA